MPSTKKQATHRTLCRCLAKSFMSFCGIASFGMINIRKTLGLAVVSTLTLALSAATISLSTPAHAVDSASASTDVTLNLGAAISVRVLDSTASQEISLLSFDLTPTSTGVTSTKTAVVDVSTSNVTGYKLYVEANGKDHNNNYTTDLVQADQDDSHVIPTSTSTTTNKNFWNYVNPALGSTSVIPAHGTPDKINQEFTPTDSTKTNIDVNIGVDTNITAGTYQNQLLFTAIANPPATDYFLYFEPGTTDTVTDLPDTMTASEIASQHTFTIPSTTPTRTGYNFTGYLDESTSTTYQAGDSITVVGDIDYTGSATLTAQWELASYIVNIANNNTTSGASSLSVPYGGSKTVTVTPNSGYYLSAVSCPSGYTCSGYSTGTSATGTQTVTVKNNNVTSGGTLAFTGTLAEKTWDTMTAMQDMTTKICNSAGTGATKTLTDTRDNNTYTIKKLKDGKCWMTQNLRLVGSRTLTSADSNVSANFTLTASDSGNWCTEDRAECDNKSMVLNSGNTTYGTYYNWYAATAGTGKYSTTSGNVSSSVCPKGWRLPTGGSSGEFQTLYNNYKSSALMRGDPAFVLSGHRDGNITNGQGSYGDFWSSTAYSSDRAYLLLLSSSSVTPAVYGNKYVGFTVRCVAQ